MTKNKLVCGTILGILHHGSAVALTLGVDEGEVLPVFFDEEPYADLLASEQCDERALLGRQIAMTASM